MAFVYVRFNHCNEGKLLDTMATFIITDFRLIIGSGVHANSRSFWSQLKQWAKRLPGTKLSLSYDDNSVSSLSQLQSKQAVVDNLHSELAPDPLAFLCLFRLCVVLGVFQLNGVGFLLSEFQKKGKARALSISVKVACQSCQRKGWSPLKKIDAGSYFEKNELGKGCLELIPVPFLFSCSQLASLSVSLCSSEPARPNILQGSLCFETGALNTWMALSFHNKQELTAGKSTTENL